MFLSFKKCFVYVVVHFMKPIKTVTTFYHTFILILCIVIEHSSTLANDIYCLGFDCLTVFSVHFGNVIILPFSKQLLRSVQAETYFFYSLSCSSKAYAIFP